MAIHSVSENVHLESPGIQTGEYDIHDMHEKRYSFNGTYAVKVARASRKRSAESLNSRV